MDPRSTAPADAASERSPDEVDPASAGGPAPAGAPPPGPARPARRDSYVARHWRGELGLSAAYWLSSILFAVAVAAAFAPLRVVDVTRHSRAWALLGIAAWAFFLAAQVWLLVGIWRSARAHPARGGSPFWAGAARVVTAIGWLGLASTAATRVGPQVLEFGRIAFGGSELAGTRVRVIRDGAEVEVNGRLGFGIAGELRRALEENPRVRIVHLNSNGGRLAEAKALADLIRERRLVTYVATECLSACVVAFAAGEERWISRRSVIGLHAPSVAGMSPLEVANATREERAFLLSRGIDPLFLARGYDTPNDDMWKPPAAEVLQARLATGFAPHDAVGISGASEDEIANVARELSKIRVYAVLERRHPDVHAAVMQSFEEGFRRGQSQEEVRAATFPRIQAVFMAAIPKAPDAAVRRFAEVVVAQGRALQEVDARHCAALLDGSASLGEMRLVPEELRQRELEVQADVIDGASADPQPTPSLEDVAPRFPAIVAAMPARAREDVALLDAPGASKAEPGRYCDAALALYEAILTRPDADAAPVLRALMAAAR